MNETDKRTLKSIEAKAYIKTNFPKKQGKIKT